MSFNEPGSLLDCGILTRRESFSGLAGLICAAAPTKANAQNQSVAYGQNTIPAGIRSRFVDSVNGLRVHILESGFDGTNRPCLLLLHGFPELAYSWRKIMLPLASAGYHVIAPDMRGYGRTTGWDGNYDADLHSFSMLNKVRDIIGLVSALGYRSADVVGHDFGSPVAGCLLAKPGQWQH